MRRGFCTALETFRRVTGSEVKSLGEGNAVEVQGWVRTVRKMKNTSFVELADGSSGSTVQLVTDDAELLHGLTTGCSIRARGETRVGPKNQLEIAVCGLDLVGSCDGGRYPIQKKRHSREFLREVAHLRPRTSLGSAVARIRHRLHASLTSFLDDKGYLMVHTPVLTSNDCEGAGEAFLVSRGDGSKFFDKDAYLTVSGQLHAEAMACGLGKVYTFGPTFRAENSHTSRHLSEFWMLEPEMAFATMEDAVQLSLECVQVSAKAVLDRCGDDVSNVLSKYVDPTLPSRLELLSQIQSNHQIITYTDAVSILQKQHTHPIQWGDDLSSEQERFLVETVFEGQVLVVSHYPAALKPFYMRQSDTSNDTVEAFDVLVPRIGELVGGSAREERIDLLTKAIERKHLKQDDLQWYIDLRRYGTVPHAGFGIGFERLVMLLTGIENVRDAIPFPRTPGTIFN